MVNHTGRLAGHFTEPAGTSPASPRRPTGKPASSAQADAGRSEPRRARLRNAYVAALREHLVDLLYVEGQLAALIEMIPAADHLLIENVAVLPALQGRGLGRRLMAHAEALAVSLGLREMRLYTNKKFASNLELYRRLGYRVDCEEPFMGGTTVYMSKPVGQSPQMSAMGEPA